MGRKASSSDSGSHRASSGEEVNNIRTKPLHVYDNITRRLLQLGITLSITTFVGLIVRYAVQEFDPSVSTITVTTSRINNRDIASLSVSKNFVERILEFIEESISIVTVIIPIGFPLCTIFNRHFAKIRANSKKFEINSNAIFNMIPKYVVIGDSTACQMPDSTRLRPLVRDTIYHLIKAHLKPKLILEDSYEDARKFGIRIGLIHRDHHKFAVIKSVDLLKNITDSRGDIKQGKVRYLLSRMKIMSQSTPADKSLLVYLIKHCESMPNENLAYIGYSFTDPEAMRLADCALTFEDCDDEDVKKNAQVILKSEQTSFTDVYLFMVICLISTNIIQSYALYQISASVSCCLFRFLSITVFQEQLISHSQFVLMIVLQQIFAIFAIMTKWLASLPQEPLRMPIAEMSHMTTEDSFALDSIGGGGGKTRVNGHRRNRSSLSGTGPETSSSIQHASSLGQNEGEDGRNQPASSATGIKMQKMSNHNLHDDTLGSSSSLEASTSEQEGAYKHTAEEDYGSMKRDTRRKRKQKQSSRMSQGGLDVQSNSRQSTPRRRSRVPSSEKTIHLSGTDLDLAIINSKLATSYKQTFLTTSLVDDVTYRLAKLHIAYQVLVMIIIMIFGNAMFQLNTSNNRQHQTLAFNSLVMNNIFNLVNCFNQVGEFNFRAGFKNHPFFVCVLLLSVAIQVCLTELNAFGLENLNPLQWFVCFVFALLSALIAPITGQQKRAPSESDQSKAARHRHAQQQQQMFNQYQIAHNKPSIVKNLSPSMARASKSRQLDDEYM